MKADKMSDEPIRSGYKRTEMGEIPEDWGIATLDQLGTDTRPAVKAGPFGSSLKKEFYVRQGYKIYGQEQVISGDPYFGDYYIDRARYLSLRSCDVIPGDLLISLVGTLGKILVVPEDAESGIINPRLLRLSFDRTKIDAIYAAYWLMSSETDRLLHQFAQGGTMGVLNASIVSRLPVHLPPLREQTAIANVLSDVDALLGALDRLIAKKRAIKQGTMQALLTGRVRIPGFTRKPGYQRTEVGVIPEDWQVKRLGELFEITSSKRVFQREWRTEGIPFYRARELAVLSERGYVHNELFISDVMYEEFKKMYGVPSPGDMLVTGVGTLGKVYIVPNDHEFYFKDGNIIWYKISDTVVSEFLRQLYLTKLIIKQINDGSAGTTVGTYTISGAKNTIIPFPDLSEQRAIAEVLSDMDAKIDALEERHAKLRAIKQGMMQELLTGHIRLVQPQEPAQEATV